MRDFERLYNKIDLGGLEELTPSLPWSKYFSAIGYPDVTDISVATPEFFERFESLVAESDLETIKTYFRWHAVRSMADYLSSDFVNADFEFYGKVMRGQEEIQPRWKRCVQDASGTLGEAIWRFTADLRTALVAVGLLGVTVAAGVTSGDRFEPARLRAES